MSVCPLSNQTNGTSAGRSNMVMFHKTAWSGLAFMALQTNYVLVNGFMITPAHQWATAATSLSAASMDDDKQQQDDFVFARRRKGRRWDDESSERSQRDEDYNRDGVEILEDEIDNGWGSDDEDDLSEDEDDLLFENILIPNPLLDSMDPDGSAERFPELVRDPRFWFDMLLFVTFLDFLSFVGPQDPFPDIPW